MTTVTSVMDQPSTWVQMNAAMRHRHKNNDERLGQAYFNALYFAWPEVADLVSGTEADPFYADDFKDPRFEKFFDVIMPYFT